jgi:integrase
MQFAEYATQWLASRDAAGELAAKTMERYRGIVRDHLIPELGGIPLARISAATVRKALGAWRNAPRRDRKPGRLSEKSIHDHFALLKQILGEAVRERLLLDNPAALVRAPGNGGSRRRTYTMRQVVALVEYLKPTPLATPVLVKALTGLRRGELLALRWRYIDLGTGELNVVESIERRRDGSLHFKTPKTEKSARCVILPGSVIAVMSKHRNQQITDRIQLGAFGEPDLVFCEPDGTPWDPDRFSSAFAYQVAKSGLPRVSLQELRHTYSSMSLRAGTPLTTTSQSMGHSTTTLTGDRYSHAVLEDFRAAADRIDRMHRAASSPTE